MDVGHELGAEIAHFKKHDVGAFRQPQPNLHQSTFFRELHDSLVVRDTFTVCFFRASSCVLALLQPQLEYPSRLPGRLPLSDHCHQHHAPSAALRHDPSHHHVSLQQKGR